MVWLIGVFRATEHTRESAPSGLFQIFALVEKMQQRPLGGSFSGNKSQKKFLKL